MLQNEIMNILVQTLRPDWFQSQLWDSLFSKTWQKMVSKTFICIDDWEVKKL
jgi:hypothetical protein